MQENKITAEILDAAIEMHKVLGGPSLLESIYEELLGFELRLRHLFVERQKVVPIVYKGHAIAAPLRLDMIVSQTVIVECKATNDYNKIYESQLLTYLRLTGLKLGLVINFGEALVSKGIHRVIN